MRPFERFLIELDQGAWGGIARVALGFAVVPAFRLLLGAEHGAWIFIAMFLGLLLALRVVPAVLRHALPFSAETKAIWADRRQLAKRHDAYQWQKLFWIGLGLALHAALEGRMEAGEAIVTATCLVGGGVGLLLWHKHRPIPAPR